MPHAPRSPRRYSPDDEYAEPAAPPAVQVDVRERAEAKVILGPHGEVLRRVEPKSNVGYRR